MGGYGSGFSGQAKATTREQHTLPLAYFKNLPSGGAVSWRLTRGGRPNGAVHIRVMETGALAFMPERGEPWQQTILIARVPVTFGGERPWLVCPHCWGHTATLYLGRYGYACRTCNSITYQSTRETYGDRAVRKADKIRRRLGWVPGVAFGHGPKPKGMHWQTFWRLVHVAACKHPRPDLQTSQFSTRINCKYRGSRTRIICQRTQIICKQPANIRAGPDYLQTTPAPFLTNGLALIGRRRWRISRRRTVIQDPGEPALGRTRRPPSVRQNERFIGPTHNALKIRQKLASSVRKTGCRNQGPSFLDLNE